MNKNEFSNPIRTAIEIAVYLLLIFALVAWCLQIVRPFISFVAWGAVIAVAMYAPFLKLRKALGGSNKLAALMFTVVGLGVFIVPVWMFGGSIIESGQSAYASFDAGEFTIPPPNDSVKSWPLVGEKLYVGWNAASSNLEEFLKDHSEQVTPIAMKAVSGIAGLGLSILQFIAATLLAAAMLANADSVKIMMTRLCRRLVGDQAEDMLALTTATIRSVTVGVLGIAVIQAIAGGAGMMVMGVPGAGIWALLILVLAIAQLPPLLVLLPVIIYVFSTNDSTMAGVLFTVWCLLVSFSDAVLKPLLLGRGVEAPMLVILLGAIGGMISAGIIGLFLGAVILALGYKLFQAWLTSGAPETGEAALESGAE
jgi:predicted PurR-regulated permease PerM